LSQLRRFCAQADTACLELEKRKLPWGLSRSHDGEAQAGKPGRARSVFSGDSKIQPGETLMKASRAKTKSIPTTKPSEPGAVDEYMKKLKHPLADVVAALRQIILKADAQIGEEIKWNAPTFFFTGEMQPSDPKEYKRYLVVFNLFKKDCIRLVFWRGANVNDKSGFLQGDYADGRRLALFHSMAEVKSRQGNLENAVRKQLSVLEK
jgi:hypothetical protein